MVWCPRVPATWALLNYQVATPAVNDLCASIGRKSSGQGSRNAHIICLRIPKYSRQTEPCMVSNTELTVMSCLGSAACFACTLFLVCHRGSYQQGGAHKNASSLQQNDQLQLHLSCQYLVSCTNSQARISQRKRDLVEVFPIAFAGPLKASAGPDSIEARGGDSASFPAAATACSCLLLWMRQRGRPGIRATSPPIEVRVCGLRGRR